MEQPTLTARHIEEARLLLNREELLKYIPQGSVTCELGVAAGGFSRLIFDTIRPEKHYMIDAWTISGRYDESTYGIVLGLFARELAEGTAEILRGPSWQTLAGLPDNSLDFIYIDTSHSYKNTVLELEVARTKIRAGGIIAGHDYKIGRFVPEKAFFLEYGVIPAVNEFMARHDWRLKYLTFEPHQTYSFAIEKI